MPGEGKYIYMYISNHPETPQRGREKIESHIAGLFSALGMK